LDKTWTSPQVDESRCTLCGLCVELCPGHAVEMGERGPVFDCPELCPIHQNGAVALDFFCLGEEVCPTGAIAFSFEIVLEIGQGV
jgi:ferredoxin